MAYQRKQTTTYSTELVFSAAAAAIRINGGDYVKAGEREDKPSNKFLMEQALSGEIEVTDGDREQGVVVREFLKTYLFKIVAGQVLNEFDSKALALANGDTVNARDIGYIAYYPKTYEFAQKLREIDELLFNCVPDHLGAVGEKISATVEIVKSFYSVTYGINFITGITLTNRVVNFVYKTGFKSGETITITGKVKALLDGHVTKLNYVKVTAS